MNGSVESLSRRARARAAAARSFVSFSLVRRLARTVQAERSQAPPAGRKPARQPEDDPYLDSWIRIDANGGMTVFTGKAELGQGIRTALLQIAAEELDVPFETLKLVTADTSRTPTKATPPAANPMQDSGTAIRNAAAQVREILIGAGGASGSAAGRPAARRERHGDRAPMDGALGYGELVAGEMLHVQAQPKSQAEGPADRSAIMGQPCQRVDIPGKGDRRRRLCSGHAAARAWCMRASCGRRATARS